MFYTVTNLVNGQLVCDLATEGKTLRLNSRETITISEDDFTAHIKNLAEKGIVKVTELVEETSDNKKTYNKKTKEKED